MRRDFIIVVGNQGYGKSAWTMTYGAAKSRLLVYDPKAEYPGVDFATPPDEFIARIVRRELAAFRYGTYLPEEVEMFGRAAYAAGETTLIMEECALLFTKGQGVEPWARPMIYMGREPQLNLVLVAQRATFIPLDIRSQANRVITFFQNDPDDIRALSHIIGAEHRDTLLTLDYLECLDWEPRIPVRRYRIKHPKAGA